MRITDIVFDRLRNFEDYIENIDELEKFALQLEDTSITEFVVLINYLDALNSILQFCASFSASLPVDVNVSIPQNGLLFCSEGDDDSSSEEDEDYEEIDQEDDDIDIEKDEEDFEELDQEVEDSDDGFIDSDEDEDYVEIDSEEMQGESANSPFQNNVESDTIDLSDDFPDFHLANGTSAINKPVLNDRIADATMETIINLGSHIKSLSDMFLTQTQKKTQKKTRTTKEV